MKTYTSFCLFLEFSDSSLRPLLRLRPCLQGCVGPHSLGWFSNPVASSSSASGRNSRCLQGGSQGRINPSNVDASSDCLRFTLEAAVSSCPNFVSQLDLRPHSTVKKSTPSHRSPSSIDIEQGEIMATDGISCGRWKISWSILYSVNRSWCSSGLRYEYAPAGVYLQLMWTKLSRSVSLLCWGPSTLFHKHQQADHRNQTKFGR